MTSFAQESTSWIPYLTKNNDFIYVDKNLNKQIDQSFYHANKFIKAGYALVQNQDDKDAIIDSKGNYIVDFTDESLALNTFRDLTFVMKKLEYDKKMPVWNWDWNIMGGDVKKTKRYVKYEIKVLETNQVLFSKDIQYGYETFTLNYDSIDENHIVMNNTLYEFKNKKFKKIRSDIELVLNDKKYIPTSENKFSIYSIDSNKPLFSDLVGTDKIELSINNQAYVLDSINQDRYAPNVPKLLQDPKTNKIYAYPKYDKPFPTQIKHATDEQLLFLRDVSLVYSVDNSPYFILGRFNYDHAVWAYDWLYIDQDGNLLNEINVKDFYILDRIGYLVWPDQHLIMSKNELEKDNKIHKISYVFQSNNLFNVKMKNGKEGIWNCESRIWILQPEYYSILILDLEQEIYAIQKEKEGKFILYNNKTKQQIGSKSYDSISGNGYVRITNEKGEHLYYYVDVYTGKEYRE